MISVFCAYLPYGLVRIVWFVARHIAMLFMHGTMSDVARNYELAFGLDPRAAKNRSRELIRQYGLTTIDLFRTRVGGPDRIPQQARHLRDNRVVAQELRHGRGGLVITGHVGNWELGGIQLAAHGYKVTMLGQPELDPEIQALRQEIRERFGIGWIEIGSTMATAFRVRQAIDRGEVVAFLVDRSYPEDQIEVEFFGRTTHFLRSPALLARFCGCPILPCYFTRNEDGGYRSYFGDAILTDAEASSEEDALRIMSEIAGVIERAIREEPTQWYNFYDYWGKSASATATDQPVSKAPSASAST